MGRMRDLLDLYCSGSQQVFKLLPSSVDGLALFLHIPMTEKNLSNGIIATF